LKQQGMETHQDSPAITRAERQTDIHLDFELEDIIAGNTPTSEPGRQILAIVENFQELPTQGKVEAALTPLYEAMTAEFYRQQGGLGEPPSANRQSLKDHAAKVIQARKVKRTALARAARPSVPRKQSMPITGFQLALIAGLVALILAVLYFRT
jgi:hypothetical protein